MGLPGKKLSKASKRRRAAHFALDPIQLVSCKKCAKAILPHRACMYCGTYKSRQTTPSRADVLIKEVSKEEVKKELAKPKAVKKTATKK